MKIEFIYTFEDRPQSIVQYPFDIAILETEERMKMFATAMLSPEEYLSLIKISCCIYTDGNEIEEPEWFVKCNGKLWFN